MDGRFKTLILGDTGVGKTSFVIRISNNLMNFNNIPAYVDGFTYNYQYENKNIA